MITISEAAITDIPIIQDIANKTWPNTYGEILSSEQLEYMMNLIYSEESLLNQIQKRQQLFFIVNDGITNIAFFSIEHQYNNEAITRINKIYILPQAHGKGIGKYLIDTITTLAKEKESKKLSLNVNKYNKALLFYQKIGFIITNEVDIEIGNGYLMEDFVMEKSI
jgi:diamine N-acetyltransferase